MDQNGQSNGGSVMALMGCGALLMVGLCVLTGVGGYMFLSAGAVSTGPVVVAPATPTMPSLPPQPFPQQPPQPFPTPQQPALPPPPQPARPSLRVRATVTFVTPGGPVASGATCDFQVEFPEAETCRAQVYCNSRLLYGGPSAGFFPCTPGPGSNVTGQDGDTTANDTDASFSISTPASIMTIRDDASGANGAFTLTARVDSVQ